MQRLPYRWRFHQSMTHTCQWWRHQASSTDPEGSRFLSRLRQRELWSMLCWRWRQAVWLTAWYTCCRHDNRCSLLSSCDVISGDFNSAFTPVVTLLNVSCARIFLLQKWFANLAVYISFFFFHWLCKNSSYKYLRVLFFCSITLTCTLITIQHKKTTGLPMSSFRD